MIFYKKFGNIARDMIKKKNKLKFHFTLLFFIGLIFLIFGILSYTLRLFSWVPVNINEVLPTETVFLLKIDLNKIEKEKNTINTENLTNKLNEFLEKKFTINFSDDIKPWIGSQAVFSILDNKKYLLALNWKNKNKTYEFINKFRTNGETFNKEEFKNGILLTPQFSSDITFGFYHNWLLISPSKTTIKEIFTKKIALKDNLEYKKIRKDIPNENIIFSFIKTEKLTENINLSESFKKYSPLLKTFASSLPYLGFSVQKKKEQITLSSKILTKEGIFAKRLINKRPNETIPKLAYMVPKDILFFTNGTDLYSKYLHTKEFLSQLDPQFSVIFDGLLQAQSEKIFGEDFKFEQDFLSKMRGQYAFILDFKDQLKPFINFTFITGFGYENNSEDISQFHDAISFAQTQFSPKLEEVELPDGTIRRELVSAKPEDIAIKKMKFKNHFFFTNSKNKIKQQFAYGFFDNNLVFSTTSEGLTSIISIIENKNNSLAENSDFKKSVLFEFSPSESYGFLNISKLIPSLQLWQDEAKSNYFTNFVYSRFRNITFSRKVFPNEIFIKAIFFSR